MEENVALDSSKQNQFVKSIKGIKKILKKKHKAEGKNESENVKTGKIKKPSRKNRGLVYLSHIPHGFYEHQMTEYFKQFGVVTNARVIRSKRTGMSKGHAFVEFRDPNVAQIVAETMNNYLMGKRLIKASIIPPEKQRKLAKRKNWNAQYNPGNILRQKLKKAHNAVKDDNENLKIARRLISNLNKTKKRLRELDIDYDFFTPVDIPETLLNLVDVKKDVKTTTVIKTEDKSKTKVEQEENVHSEKKKKKKNVKDNEVKAQDSTPLKQVDNLIQKKSKKSKEIQTSVEKPDLSKTSTKNYVTNIKVSKVENNISKQPKDKKVNKNVEENNKQSKIQKQKEKKLKDAGVKLPENFIPIQNESHDESDSSVDFDSDEFDKVMNEDDSDVGSQDGSDESDVDLDDEITSEEDVSIKEEPTKVGSIVKTKVEATKNKQPDRKQTATKPQAFSMKIMPQKEDKKSSKKPKFEKKANKKTINKVIKKK